MLAQQFSFDHLIYSLITFSLTVATLIFVALVIVATLLSIVIFR